MIIGVTKKPSISLSRSLFPFPFTLTLTLTLLITVLLLFSFPPSATSTVNPFTSFKTFRSRSSLPTIDTNYNTNTRNRNKKFVMTRRSPSPPPTTTNNNNNNNNNMSNQVGGPPPGPIRRMFPNYSWSAFPDLLTIMRVWAIPLLVLCFYINPKQLTPSNILSLIRSGGEHGDLGEYNWKFSSLLFSLASFTDFLDGYLARRWQITSPFGAFLDPVADKLMVCTSLILLSSRYGMLITLMTVVVLCREISVSALREWMADKKLKSTVQVNYMGKCKTALTMLSITILLATPYPVNALGEGYVGVVKGTYWVGVGMLGGSTVLTVWSGCRYFNKAGPVLMEGRTVEVENGKGRERKKK